MCTFSCVQHVFRYGLIACNQAYPCADEEANLYGFHGVFSSHSIQLAELQLSTATLDAYAKQVLLVVHCAATCLLHYAAAMLRCRHCCGARISSQFVAAWYAM